MKAYSKYNFEHLSNDDKMRRGTASNVYNKLWLLRDLTTKPVLPVSACQHHAPNIHPYETVKEPGWREHFNQSSD